MKFIKFIIFIWLFVIIVGCESNQDKLIVGLIKPSLNHLPFDFGLEIGELDQEDYQIKYFSSGWETNESLVAGKIDVAILPFTYIWTDVSNEKKVKIISFLERESDGIIASKNIESITELNGKKIGVLRASTLDIFAEMFAEKNEVEWEFVYFRTPMDMASALKSGEVDALSYYVPSIFKFPEDEFHIIHWFGDDFAFHPCCDIAATETALNDKLPLIKRFLKGMKESCRNINNSPLVAFEGAQKFFGLTFREAKNSLHHTRYLMDLSTEHKEFEKNAVDIMIRKGYIKNRIEPRDVYYEVK
ncbi:MAG: ABC transporter substrate-binding protein [Candidatus Cloacimonetes bacterium]|nr:ABC transporter substrate-binding protein [Candidatus Cloacimonadota bacterium]